MLILLDSYMNIVNLLGAYLMQRLVVGWTRSRTTPSACWLSGASKEGWCCGLTRLEVIPIYLRLVEPTRVDG